MMTSADMGHVVAMQLLELGARLGGMGVCALVVAACICRIDLMRGPTHRSTWIGLYLLFAVYAGGVGLTLLLIELVEWYVAAGLAGVLLYLVLTRHEWRTGAPAYTRRVARGSAGGAS